MRAGRGRAADARRRGARWRARRRGSNLIGGRPKGNAAPPWTGLSLPVVQKNGRASCAENVGAARPERTKRRAEGRGGPRSFRPGRVLGRSLLDRAGAGGSGAGKMPNLSWGERKPGEDSSTSKPRNGDQIQGRGKIASLARIVDPNTSPATAGRNGPVIGPAGVARIGLHSPNSRTSWLTTPRPLIRTRARTGASKKPPAFLRTFPTRLD